MQHTVFECVAACCSELQGALQCIAVWCSIYLTFDQFGTGGTGSLTACFYEGRALVFAHACYCM